MLNILTKFSGINIKYAQQNPEGRERRASGTLFEPHDINCMHIHTYVHELMYVCIVCMFMCVCMHICTYMHELMYVCLHVCMYAHTYVHYLQQCVVTVLTPCKRNLSNDNPTCTCSKHTSVCMYVDSSKVYWYIRTYVHTCVTQRVCVHMLYDRT